MNRNCNKRITKVIRKISEQITKEIQVTSYEKNIPLRENLFMEICVIQAPTFFLKAKRFPKSVFVQVTISLNINSKMNKLKTRNFKYFKYFQNHQIDFSNKIRYFLTLNL